MSAHPVETYLHNLSEIHRTGGGTAEESYYGALETLLNEIGGKLTPKVRCIPQLKNTGGGEPDFGLYTANQFQRARDERPLTSRPERGVIECKPWNDDSVARIQGAQVARYLAEYGLVLVTNFRDFVLVTRDPQGQAASLETFRLAESENAFRALLAHPRQATQQRGDRLVEFLRRVLLHAAPLTDPEDLAWFLASYAREARARVEEAAGLPALAGLKKALEEALGMRFEGDKGEHFFRATLVQTLFYGVFSSWVLWARTHPASGDRFDWHAAGWTLHVPMVRSLFEQIATPNKLKPLRVDEVLDWAGLALNRVIRAAFFQKFEAEHAVQYFYEPFLKAYDPELRKDLGVWYTPPEIVQYQVERVDRVLREELGLPDGLADEQVVVLDPCCGTGAYLVETLKRIHKTLQEKGSSALTAHKLKQAAMKRVFGFEILPAPFVVAHLQLGLMLRLLGAPFDAESDERAGVYLTNALTGWEPLKDPKNKIVEYADPSKLEGKKELEVEQLVASGMLELADELIAARNVKREKKILVIIGNPPYNAFAGASPDHEGELVDAYKEGLNIPVEKGGWGIKKFNLEDLYVRFFRIAERRIAKSGKGVVCYISNFSYLGDPSFVVMRQRFLQEFDKLWFDCMNGDSRETGKVTPEGKPDPSVFSTEQSAVGIRVGTAICLMVRKETREKKPVVRFQHYWGADKTRDLLASLKLKNIDRKYQTAKPGEANRFSFHPATVSKTYLNWPRVLDLSAVPPGNGLMEKRGGALMDIERSAIEARMKAYFDTRLDWAAYQSVYSALAEPQARFDPKQARMKALALEKFQKERIVRYALRPFDTRWAYYCPIRPVWNEPRPALWAQCWKGNSFFMTRPAGVADPEGVPFFHTPLLGDNDFQRGHSYFFPIRLRNGFEEPKSNEGQMSVFEDIESYHTIRANLSNISRDYLAQLGIKNPDKDAETAGLIWMHALAIGCSPAYLAENADGIRQDWPHIPLPASRDALLASAALGLRVAALLDTEQPVEGVSRGKIPPELRSIASVSKVGGGSLDPAAGELDLTAGWGHAGQGGACMPGKGKTEAREQPDERLRRTLGAATLDVYLNGSAFWANVPEQVWDYTIGGYQVIKKWLSYREKSFLGRGLKLDEAEYVTEMARRLAALILLQPELDANYQAVKSATWPWPER